jgi:hypothetical protein
LQAALEVVIGDNKLGSVLSGGTASTHGEADLGLLERIDVVDAFASYTDLGLHIFEQSFLLLVGQACIDVSDFDAAGLEADDHLLLVLGVGASKHFQGRHDLLEVVHVLEFLVLDSGTALLIVGPLFFDATYKLVELCTKHDSASEISFVKLLTILSFKFSQDASLLGDGFRRLDVVVRDEADVQVSGVPRVLDCTCSGRSEAILQHKGGKQTERVRIFCEELGEHCVDIIGIVGLAN